MFKYKFVEDGATNKRYWIDRAALVNDEGPCTDGGDWYNIDLQPINPDGTVITGLDLIDFGDEVHITAQLDPKHREESTGVPGHFRSVTVLAEVRGDTLIVSQGGRRDPVLNLETWVPCDEDRPDIIRELWFEYSNMMSGTVPRPQRVSTGRLQKPAAP